MVTALRVIMIHITPQLNQFSYLYCFNSEPLLVPRATLSSLYTYAGVKIKFVFPAAVTEMGWKLPWLTSGPVMLQNTTQLKR